MKVIQINCVYGHGSTGVLTQTLHRGLRERGYEMLAVYGRGESVCEDGVIRLTPELYGKANGLRARITGLMYGGCEASTTKLIKYLIKEKPDVVHLQCINGTFVNIYRLVSYLNRAHIPTVITLHAEFLYTANCSHAYDCERWKTGCGHCVQYRTQTRAWFRDASAASWRRMAAAFDGFARLSVISVSPWQMERAKASPFFVGARHLVIGNGVDTAVFRPCAAQKSEERIKIVNVTPGFDLRHGHNKGANHVLELAKRLDDRAEIRVVGPANGVQGPENVVFLGPIRDPKVLARIYSEADLTLLTSRRETFSMVCAESLCCGTPVVGFRAGGPESITIPEYSSFCEYGDLEALEKAVLSPPVGDRAQIAEAARARYGLDRMIEQYLDEYQKVSAI